MHSFHHSRGRILFEVLCALAVSASLAAASIQTGASALLAAAAVAGLFGLVHLFDLKQPKAAVAAEPQRVEFEPKVQKSLPASPDAEEVVTAVEQSLATATTSEEVQVAEPTALRATGNRRKGGSRKGSGRRASPRKTAEVIEFAPAEESLPEEAAAPVHPDEAEVAELDISEETNVIASEDFSEPAQVPHTPLFEPEPYVRMPRPAFGRKAG